MLIEEQKQALPPDDPGPPNSNSQAPVEIQPEQAKEKDSSVADGDLKPYAD